MLETLYSWYGKKVVIGAAALIIVLVVVGAVVKLNTSTVVEDVNAAIIVETAQVAELAGGDTAVLLGTVAAVSEAKLLAEVPGRVTSVPVALGQSVRAGTVIATLENAAQRAAVLQAEGAYEAAVAAASVSDVSVAQAETGLASAKNAAITSAQNAYTTTNNTFFTTIDDLYRDPSSPLTYPIIFDDNRAYLARERVAFQDILPAWQSEVTALDQNSDLHAALATSLEHTTRTRNLVDSFLSIMQTRDDGTLSGIETRTWISTMNGLRSTLDATIADLRSKQSQLTAAEDTLTQARIGGTGSSVSAADAQVKQALGVLRSAQANLAKTIITAPIAGTLNELNVKVGDYVSSFAPVAKVANNNALEVTVFAGERDLALITVGSPVVIDGTFEGVVTNIGVGIDSVTQKTEVKIATEATELINGDTVSVSIAGLSREGENNGRILLPITAIKFSDTDGSVFTVEEGVLVAYPVTLGVVHGGVVEVTSGITPDMEIVVDARGLTPGTSVEAK